MSTHRTQQPVNAQRIREFIRLEFVEPARRRRETLVTVRAGDIHKALGLKNRVPNVCQVMESRLLEREAGVKVSSKQGPPSGRGTTLTVTYTVEPNKPDSGAVQESGIETAVRNPAEHPGVALFYALRGIGKEMFAAEGGGEAWLKRERAEFYGPAKKELN